MLSRSSGFPNALTAMPAAGFSAWCLRYTSLRAERFVDAAAYIFRADVAFEFGLLHELRRLFSRATEKQRAARVVHLIGEIANSAETGGINGGHIAQPENDDRRQRGQVIQNVGELIRGAEQKGPVNAIHGGVLRNVLPLQDVSRPSST